MESPSTSSSDVPRIQEQAPASSEPASEPASGQGVIVAFGDSLTAGLGVAPQDSYPARLEAKLRREGHAYRVINAGISGDTTAGGLRRVDWVLRAEPDIVILELGANDGLRGVQLGEVRSNLDRIIERLQEAGAQVILAGMKVPPNYGPLYAEGFRRLYEDLAEKHKIPLIPFFLEGVAAEPALNQADGIHPNAQGYLTVTENVWEALKPLL